MRIPRVFTSQALIPGATVDLEPGASHHLLKVLRMEVGRELILFNGQGGEYLANIESITKKNATALITEHNPVERESPLETELAIGISRGDRFEWVLQKATELGVTRLAPLLTERGEVKLTGERLQKKMAQWQKILVSACEQCQRNRLPTLCEPQPLNDYIAGSVCELRMVLHHRSNKALQQHATPHSVALLIGPEGGLSESEIEAAIQHGFNPLSVGPRVLRTETAPVVALSLVQSLWGDF